MKNDPNVYVAATEECLCAIIILLYLSTFFSRHPTKTTRTTRPSFDNLPKVKVLSVFFTGNPNLHLYTANTVSRYWYSDTLGHGPDLWHHRLGIGNVHFPDILRHCFLFNTVRRPRTPSPNDNALSENTQMRLDFKNKITSSDVRTVSLMRLPVIIFSCNNTNDTVN
ncbi:hypothetical protein QTP88_007525 [Uroleucon formosanum]